MIGAVDKQFIRRLGIFFSERYPLITGFLSSALGVLSMYLIWCSLNDSAALIFNKYFFSAVVTMFLLTLILRLCDELKDKEVDKVLFPERCLPAGKVHYEDVKILLSLCTLVFIALNLVLGGDIVLFGLLTLYIYLFYKYFFFPHVISQNLIMALVTHNPLLLVSSLYVLSIFSLHQGISVYTAENIILAVAFWMPSLGWETARKIRSPEDETDYETYSKVLGPKAAAMIPTGAFSIQAAAILFLTQDFTYFNYILVGVVTLLIIYILYFLLFILSLKKFYAKRFQLLTEGYILLSSTLIVTVAFLES